MKWTISSEKKPEKKRKTTRGLKKRGGQVNDPKFGQEKNRHAQAGNAKNIGGPTERGATWEQKGEKRETLSNLEDYRTYILT